jgi:Ca2+-binding EF-hand superfamily protein
MHRFLFGIPILLTVAGAAAWGAETNPLAGLDANSDGVVSRAEFDAARRRDFRLLDRNRNKVVSRHEFYRRGRPEDRALLALRKRRYRLMDVNDDGGITLAEYLAYGHRVFARMDRDRDRRLSAAEVAAARGVQVASQDTGPADATAAKLRRATADDRDAPKGHARALADMPFATIDRDGDGFASRVEYRRAVLVLFQRLDRNGNKVISRHEYYRRGSVNDKLRLAARKVAYRRADQDDDGGLTAAEFTKMAHRLFVRIDANHDRRLSRDEWVAAFGAPPAPTGPTAANTTAAKIADTAPAARAKPAARMASTAKRSPKPKTTPAAKTAPKPDTSLMAQLRADRRRKAERKTAPQVASRPPATAPVPGKKPAPKATTALTPKSTIDPRVAFAFRSFDRDNDGKISALELVFARMTRFTILDANHDRVLEGPEFIGNRGPAAAARFREMDRNGNGLVTWDEYKVAGIARFKQVDTNGDGKLSLAEFANAGRAPSKVTMVKKVKIRPTLKARPVITPHQARHPFQFEVPSR